MDKTSLHTWYIGELLELHDAECQIEDTLPVLAQATQDRRITAAFEHQLRDATLHRHRLTKILRSKAAKLGSKPCGSMRAILAEASSVMANSTHDQIRDAMFISVMQRAQHYKVAAYDTARMYGDLLIEDEQVEALYDSLEEEEAILGELSDLAVNHFFAIGLGEAAAADVARSFEK